MPTKIYSLSLHDALPIFPGRLAERRSGTLSGTRDYPVRETVWVAAQDRKSTRLNSSHSQISYAVFCLKKKKIARIHSATSRQHTQHHVYAQNDILQYQLK